MEASTTPSDDDWFRENVLDLVEKYPNQWIAVSSGKVICTSATRWGAKSEAKRLAGRGNFSLYFIEPSMLQMGTPQPGPSSQEGPR